MAALQGRRDSPMTGPFPLAVERFPVVRQSVLSTFDSCALAAKFDMEHRVGWSSHLAALGQIVHRAIAKCLEVMDRQQEGRVPVDLALDILDDVLRQHDVVMDGNPLGDEVVSLPLRLVAEARIIMRTWARNAVYDPTTFAGIERRLETTLCYPDDHGEVVERRFTGKLDLLLIDGLTAYVEDNKTGWGIPSEGTQRLAGEEVPEGDNISEEGYFQMRAYALLVFRTYPRIQRVVMREVYPRYMSGAVERHGRLINPIRQATMDRYLLPELEAELNALIERFDRAVQTGVFRPAPSSACSYCPRPSACTIFPEARAEGRIARQEEAIELAGRLNVSEARAKQIRKALTAWTRAHGEVPIRDSKRPRVFGPVVRTRVMKPDAVTVARHVAQGGRPEELYVPEEYVRFGAHTPEEQHPHAREARAEEEALLAMERAAAQRKAAR